MMVDIYGHSMARLGKIVVIDPERNDCTLATYDMPSEYDKEGLTLDKERGLAYVAVDENWR